jgi:mannose/cellobiose epimerase-like protein (N-acyl-D-glucosamine 2-epimerase family)
MSPLAKRFFDTALEVAWDAEHDGFFYAFTPERVICNRDKYHWVHAESLATAALLGREGCEGKYWECYDQLWEYVWEHFVDHEHGAWFGLLAPDNHRYDDKKSPAGKTDYHNMGACYEVLNAL